MYNTSRYQKSPIALVIKRLIIGSNNRNVTWIELFTACFISIIVWLTQDQNSIGNTQDYFFWPMLGPLVIALRYGFAKGMQCFFIMIIIMQLVVKSLDMTVYFSLSVAVGSAVVIMIIGEFTDHWHSVNKNFELNYRYMEQKLQSFTQNYHLLKISHDQLEQRSAGKMMSLRTSIQILQQAAISETDNRLDKLGEECLHILMDVVGMFEAGIYRVKDGVIVEACISSIGEEHKLITDDAMLLEMMEHKRVLTPSNSLNADDPELYYKLAVPLVDASGELQGIVLAEKIQFMSLTKENIALMALVASYTANFMCENIHTPVLEAEQFPIFEKYLAQLQWNKKHYGVDSALVVFIDKSANQTLPIDKFVDYRRGADIYWTCYTKEGHVALVTLLPMTTAFEAQKFVERLSNIVKEDSQYKVEPQINIVHEVKNCSSEQVEIMGPYIVFEQYEEVIKILTKLGGYNEDLAVHSCNTI